MTSEIYNPVGGDENIGFPDVQVASYGIDEDESYSNRPSQQGTAACCPDPDPGHGGE